MSKITPFFWFENEAEDALELYAKVFPDAKITGKQYWPAGSPMPEGTLLTASISLFGQDFAVLNGRPPEVKNSNAISFMVACDTQDEIDSYWDQLTADGGKESMCGWLVDKFGVSWQITPSQLQGFIGDPDPEKSGRAMQAMMGMRKLDIAALEAAYYGT